MKNVKYVGTYEAYLPTLGIYVVPGDVIEVEDDFESVLFVLAENATVTEAPEITTVKLKGDK